MDTKLHNKVPWLIAYFRIYMKFVIFTDDIEMLPLHKPSKATASSNTNTQGADTHMNAAVDAPSSDADMTSSVDTAGGSGSSISKTGTALYDFTAENDAELSLKVLLLVFCGSPLDNR